MLKDPNTPVFEEKWPCMRPTILKLLRQVRVANRSCARIFKDKVTTLGWEPTPVNSHKIRVSRTKIF